MTELGGLRTILIGSGLQAIALIFYLFAETLPGLFAVSVIFGLFQGGIVPCYALIVREYFPSSEAGVRLGVVISAAILSVMASLVGAFIAPARSTMVFFVALFVMLLVKPHGMFGKYLE